MITLRRICYKYVQSYVIKTRIWLLFVFGKYSECFKKCAHFTSILLCIFQTKLVNCLPLSFCCYNLSLVQNSHTFLKKGWIFSLLNFSVVSNALCWWNWYFWIWLNVCTKHKFLIKTYLSMKCQTLGNIWLSLSTHIWANNKSSFGMNGDKTRPK